MMLKMILQLALAVLLGTQAGAQDSTGDADLDSLISEARETFFNVERFQLFNECRPMALWPVDVDTESGLTKDRIQTLAESRLRAARLYLDHDSPAAVERNRPLAYLGVSVKATKTVFFVAVNYNKRVYDPVSDVSASTETWTESIFGTHFGDGDFVLQGLSEQIDKFILEYLRVNEAACK